MADSTEPIVLNYWNNLRGPVQTILYLLEYLKVPYTFKTIEGLPEYKEFKKTLREEGRRFPNVPSINHKGRYISECRALAHYICTVAGRPELQANSENIVEWIQLEGIISDTFWDLTRVAYVAKDLEDLKKIYRSWALKHKTRFAELAELIKERGLVFGGDQVTFLDFFLAELTERILAMETAIGIPLLSENDGIKQHHERVLAVPEIAAYREKNQHGIVGAPWNSAVMAAWY